MAPTKQTKALLLVSTHCPHCHALKILLDERQENGALADVEVVNIEHSPEVAQRYGVRSVPWLRLDNFEFDSALTSAELDKWIRFSQDGGGEAEYISRLLETGSLTKAIEWIEAGNTSLSAVVSLLTNPAAKMNVRVGIGAIFEHFEDTDKIKAILAELVDLLESDSAMVRTDVCHYLSLTHSAEAVEALVTMLNDENAEVRQVAEESLEALKG